MQPVEVQNLSFCGGRLAYVAGLYKVFGYLNSIKCCTFPYLVARKPEGIAVVVSQVFTNATDVNIVLSRAFQRHWIDIMLRVVNQSDARCRLQSLANLGNT